VTLLVCRAAHVREYDLHQPMATDPRHEAVPVDAMVAMNLLLDQVMLAETLHGVWCHGILHS
jgi:hypothetical protein